MFGAGGRGFAPSCKSSLRSPNVDNATHLLSAGGRGCSALFVLFIFFITLQSFLLNKHAAQRHVTNCSFDQTIAVNVICLSFACLFLFPASTQYPAGTPNLGGGVLATVFRDSKRRRKNASSFAGAENRTRTGTDVTPRDFKSLASAYSATSASLEASPGIEPGMKALQASALPLGYDAIRKRAFDKTFVILTLERETGFGPATSTLARWHSTTESLPQVGRFAPSFSATTIIYQIN